MNIHQALGLLGHSTEWAGLHPNLQAKAAEATSILAGIGTDPLSVIGCETAWDVAPAFFAALDRTGEKAAELGYTPLIARFGDAVELYEIPGPVAFTVASTVSRRAAVVVLMYSQCNLRGYGDLDTADGFVEGIYDDVDAANDRVMALQKAIKTLRTVASMTAQRGETSSSPEATGPAF